MLVTSVRMITLLVEPELPIASASQMFPVRCSPLPFTAAHAAPPMKQISYLTMGEKQKQANYYKVWRKQGMSQNKRERDALNRRQHFFFC